MIWQIIRREILENILSLRFMLSLLLVIVLFAVSGFVFVSQYRQQLDDYWEDTNKSLQLLNEQTDHIYKLALHKQVVYRKPKLLALCTEGSEKILPNHFKFNVFSKDYPEVRGRMNFFLSRFSDLDWIFIISLFLSFVALVLSYDRICGEREAGTLRLMLAGPIPRYKVLMGKYIGVMFVLGIPLLIGILINLIIVVFSKDVNIHPNEWLKIIVIVFLSFLCLSIFVLLGLFVSSRTAHSASSMVVLLLIWVGMIFIIPGFGRIIASTFRKVPTQAEMLKKQNDFIDQLFKDVLSGKYGENSGRSSPSPNDNNPPARARLYNAITDATNGFIDGYLNKMMAQVAIGRQFAKISPAEIYRQACETVAGTGIKRFSELRRQTRNYQADFKEFIRSKDAEDPDSMHLLFEEENTANWWKTMSHKPVDFDSVPKFVERDLGLGESLRLAIWDIGLLVLFNLVFFAAAFVSFLKYDVR